MDQSDVVYIMDLVNKHSDLAKRVAALEEKFTSANKASTNFFCCLGKQHPCVLNVNDGFCSAESCQYRVA